MDASKSSMAQRYRRYPPGFLKSPSSRWTSAERFVNRHTLAFNSAPTARTGTAAGRIIGISTKPIGNDRFASATAVEMRRLLSVDSRLREFGSHAIGRGPDVRCGAAGMMMPFRANGRWNCRCNRRAHLRYQVGIQLLTLASHLRKFCARGAVSNCAWACGISRTGIDARGNVASANNHLVARRPISPDRLLAVDISLVRDSQLCNSWQ